MKKVISTSSKLENVIAFIDLCKDIAIICEKKYGIPAEVMIAQSALETGWGKTIKGNNYFNIKAGSSWDGETYDFGNVKEIINGKIVYIPAKWRKYKSIQESFVDYCNLISTLSIYKVALVYGVRGDAENYIKELYKAGYATDAPKEVDGDPSYSEKILSIINKYINVSFVEEKILISKNMIEDIKNKLNELNNSFDLLNKEMEEKDG